MAQPLRRTSLPALEASSVLLALTLTLTACNAGPTVEHTHNNGDPAAAPGEAGCTPHALSAGGGRHTCALLQDSAVRCWGEVRGAPVAIAPLGARP